MNVTDRVLVWDASPLHHAALADRLDSLADLAQGPLNSEAPWRNIVTDVVLEELRDLGAASTSDLE